MNFGQANAVMHLAPGVNEVLKKLEWKCPKCTGNSAPIGMLPGQYKLDVPEYGDEVLRKTFISCPKCNGTGKVNYSCAPYVGQWAIYKDKILLITKFRKDVLEGENSFGDISTIIADKSILILEWEECFNVLFKAGYSAQMEYTTGHKSLCTIKRPGLTRREIGSSPTEATYLAILRLGKAIK